jgi:hypothetical protein
MAVGRARAIRALLALIAVSACLGAVAYAAMRPGHRAPGLAEGKPIGTAPQQGTGASPGAAGEQLPQARLIERPDAISVVAEPQFRFHVPPGPQRLLPSPQGPPGQSPQPERPRRFQCRLDGGGWRACSSPLRLGGLAPGNHSFATRAFSRAGQPGPAVAYSWRQAEPPSEQERVDPKPFSVELRGKLEDLYPGFPPQQLPVLISNPNSIPIEVTSLTAAIAGGPPDCPAENFALTPSSASPATPVTVPAGGSANLPTTALSAPTIRMLNLTVNQDACQGTDVPLVFEGEAHG